MCFSSPIRILKASQKDLVYQNVRAVFDSLQPFLQNEMKRKRTLNLFRLLLTERRPHHRKHRPLPKRAHIFGHDGGFTGVNFNRKELLEGLNTGGQSVMTGQVWISINCHLRTLHQVAVRRKRSSASRLPPSSVVRIRPGSFESRSTVDRPGGVKRAKAV